MFLAGRASLTFDTDTAVDAARHTNRKNMKNETLFENSFASMQLPVERTVVAADGSDVRVLLALKGGSMAHFSLQAGQTSKAMTHRTVEEVWFVTEGAGEMWRQQGSVEETISLTSGTCLTIPLGTHFQFRATADQSLGAVCVTMPPWPADPSADEAVAVVGRWSNGDLQG